MGTRAGWGSRRYRLALPARPAGKAARWAHQPGWMPALNPFGVRRVLDGGWTSRHTLLNGAGSRLGPVFLVSHSFGVR